MNLLKKLEKGLARYESARQQVREEKAALEKERQAYEDAKEAQAIIQSVAEAVQETAHRQIASVVSRCLETVFGEDAYQFRIRFSKKRGKTEAELLFVRGDLEVDPTTAAGGGVVDVAAFALRLACLVLSRPACRRFLALDEPFRFVSREYIPRVRDMLSTLSQEMNVQFLIITHIPQLKIGKVIELD